MASVSRRIILSVFIRLMSFVFVQNSSPRKDSFPVFLYTYNRPSPDPGFIPRLIQRADGRFAVVSPFAFRVGVMNDQRETRAVAGRGPFEHLLIAVGIAKRRDGPPADERLNANGLAVLVVNELHVRQFHEHRF